MLSQVLTFDEWKPSKGLKREKRGCGIQKQYGK